MERLCLWQPENSPCCVYWPSIHARPLLVTNFSSAAGARSVTVIRSRSILHAFVRRSRKIHPNHATLPQYGESVTVLKEHCNEISFHPPLPHSGSITDRHCRHTFGRCNRTGTCTLCHRCTKT